MVKLFGWEMKMAKRIEEKRDDELKALWNLKVSINLCDCAQSTQLSYNIFIASRGIERYSEVSMFIDRWSLFCS
jgi:hypothetical protein